MINAAFKLKRLMEGLCVIIMSVMALMVFLNVALRYLLNMSITTSEELSRFFFVWLTFMAAIIAYQEKSHICVDFIVKKFGAGAQRIFKVLVDVLIVTCSYFITSGSIALTILGLKEVSPVTQLPMAVLYISGVIGGAGIGLIALYRLYLDLTGRED